MSKDDHNHAGTGIEMNEQFPCLYFPRTGMTADQFAGIPRRELRYAGLVRSVREYEIHFLAKIDLQSTLTDVSIVHITLSDRELDVCEVAYSSYSNDGRPQQVDAKRQIATLLGKSLQILISLPWQRLLLHLPISLGRHFSSYQSNVIAEIGSLALSEQQYR